MENEKACAQVPPMDHDPTPRPTNPREIPIYARLGGGEIWRDIVGTERDEDPCGRFAYVAERLIEDSGLREATLRVMREVRGRCFEKDENHYYRFERRGEIDAEAFVARVRPRVERVSTIAVATMTELVPMHAWMTRQQWTAMFRRHVEVMTAADGRNPTLRRSPLDALFGFAPAVQLKEFEMPARGVLTGNLVHKSLMGDLAQLLAVVGAFAAAGLHDRFDGAAAFVMEAAKAPPIIVAREDDGFDLIHVCRD